MSLLTMQEELSADERVCDKRIVYHPSYASRVIQIRYGWKKGGEIVWDKNYEIRNLDMELLDK